MSAGQVLVDRTHERAILDSLVESAVNGTSGALVLHGEAGMGKTALLDYAASSGALSIARISGVETESQFGFAALHRLLLPLLHQIDTLPRPQRLALESAFGLLDGNPPDRFMVGLAALNLLSIEGEKAGLLCIVDDAQWIDVESLQTLAFVGRRLRAEGVVLLFGLRTHLELPPDLAGIAALEVVGLPSDAAAELLHIAADRPLSEQVAERIMAETRGCPLALWEFGRTWTEETSVGIGSLEEPIAITSRLEQHFNDQIASLSSDTQLFLLVAAADVSGDRALIRTAARSLGCTPQSEKEAERQRLVLTGPRITFRHPMIRSAVYAGADPDLRREVHRTFSKLISKSSYPDRWARHVVLGASGPNAQLAFEIDETAQMARARGGYSAEAALLVQAAELTDTLELRADRLLRAAAAAMNAGTHATNQVLPLLDQAEPHLADPLSVAEAAQLRAQLHSRTFQPSEVPRLLLEAARLFQPINIQRAREVLLEAFEAYVISVHLSSGVEAIDIAEVEASTRGSEVPAPIEHHLLVGTSQLFSEGPKQAFGHYRLAAELLREETLSNDQIARWTFFGLVVANELLDDSTFRSWSIRVDRSARDIGALLVLLHNLQGLAEGELRSGDLRSSLALFEEAEDVAGAIGMPAEHIRPNSVLAHGWEGDEETTTRYASKLDEVHSALGSQHIVIMGRYALTVLHLGAGRYGEALRASDYVHSDSPIGWTSPSLPLAIEAAVRSGDLDLAKSLLLRLEERATASGSRWGMGLMARSKALLSVGSEAEECYRTSISLLEQTLVPRDVAHARLLYGEWLRRENRRLDAREQLRTAHEFFQSMGAKGFADRAKSELLATGERVRSRTVATSSDLTPQERRIATLAAERLSNPEIAAKLFISSATVDYHLRKVFRKLNIASRRELGEALRSHTAS